MNLVLVVLLLQSFFMPPRLAVENPAAVTPVPQKIKKDFDKMWARFRTGKEDVKVMKDAEKLLKSQIDSEPVLTLEAYIDLYAGRYPDAERKLATVLAHNPQNRIAVSYLAEISFARQDYARASELYSKLLAIDSSRGDVEPKRQKALLLATENLLRNAAKAENENRLTEAESMYREALRIAPAEPFLHGELGELLLREKKWDEAVVQFRRQIQLNGPNDEAQRHLAEALMNLGRTDEARSLLEELRKTGNADDILEAKVKELEDLGRWGADIQEFRRIESSTTLTREQLSAMIVRYFPQVTEFRQTPQIVTDTEASWASLEIQTIVGVGLVDPFLNHTFQPSKKVSREEFAVALARLSRLLGLFANAAPPVPARDLAPRNPLYSDVQLTVALGLMTLDEAGNFNVNGSVSGEEAVNAIERLSDLLRQKTG